MINFVKKTKITYELKSQIQNNMEQNTRNIMPSGYVSLFVIDPDWCGCSGGDKIALKCGLKLWKKVFGLGLI